MRQGEKSEIGFAPPRQRLGSALHPEVDAALVESWLAEPSMAKEAVDALGENALADLRYRAVEYEPQLLARSTPGFQAFADLLG